MSKKAQNRAILGNSAITPQQRRQPIAIIRKNIAIFRG